MIIGSNFPGDNDIAVMRVQAETFGELVGYLFFNARARYMDAVRLIGKIDDVAVTVQAVTEINRAVLEAAHDRIAAYFRYTHPNLSGRDQLRPGSPAKDEVARRWRAYFHTEARELANDDYAVRAILKAVVLQGSDTGRDYQGVLMDRLRERYPLPEGPVGTPE
ncbi:MAG TPA: hypothetical protein VF678_14340 [bacterium]